MKFNGLKNLREIFIMTRGERRGTIVLLILLGILFSVRVSIDIFLKDNEEIYVFPNEEMTIINKDSKADHKTLNTHKFDPNLVSVFDLREMGIPEYVCKNFEKYRNKGGRFKKSEDLRKIYGISDEFYKQLCDSMIFTFEDLEIKSEKKTILAKSKYRKSETENEDHKIQYRIRQNDMQAIPINSADSTEFILVKGIGPVLSKRIVRYRELLGGFYSIEQLKEVYGMKEEVIMNSLSVFKLDSMRLKAIDINFASKKELASHPYISWDDAQLIIDLRKKNGFVDQPSVFLYNNFDSSRVVKMIPYFLK